MTKTLDHDPFEDSDHEEDCDYLEDSDLEDNVETTKPATNDYPGKQNQNTGAGEGSYNELDRQGKVVILRGIAYLTLV